jgi:hypothetical protein
VEFGGEFGELNKALIPLGNYYWKREGGERRKGE